MQKNLNQQKMDTTTEMMNIKCHIINIKIDGYDLKFISSESGCFDVQHFLYLLDFLGVDYIHRSIKNV